MQAVKKSWLLAVILVLALAAMDPAAAGAGQKTAAEKDQGDPPEIQIIRRVSVAGVFPAERGASRDQREACKAKAASNSTPSTRFSSNTVRSNPVRSVSTRSTAVRSTSIPPIRIAPGRA
ncbi:MAG: hypothetical protein C4567_06155 [Deltaproteobacteria bacterium]|nr:MAG: hypothetical protein C4567_06155 [Deltaproteobacteria bacterium]